MFRLYHSGITLLLSLFCMLMLQQNTWAKARLYVKSSPKNSIITIWNIKQKFHQGMHLPAGNYDLQIHKAGYKAYRKTIYVGKNTKYINVRLHPKNEKKHSIKASVSKKSYPLYVYVQNVPLSQVKIQILNINPKFKQGILLKSGHYKLKITAAGYRDYRKTVKINHKGVDLEMDLVEENAVYDSTIIGNSDETLAVDMQYPVYISTSPKETEIKILNIKPRFYQGIQLPAGKYLLEVSKKGYIKQKQWFEIIDNYAYVDVSLKQGNNTATRKHASSVIQQPSKYQLSIVTRPLNAQVYILNIQQPYTPKMRLKSGHYLLQISAPYYASYQQWIEIVDADVHLEIQL